MQQAKVQELADHVSTWLHEGLAVVGINEIHPVIAVKLVNDLLFRKNVDVGIATHETNSVLWRTPP